MPYKPFVKSAQKALDAHEIGQDEVVNSWWKAIEWMGHETPLGQTTARLDAQKNTTIHLYPPLTYEPDPRLHILREFGLLLLAKGGERSQSIWDKKLITPTPDQVNTFEQALKDEKNRSTCNRYEDLINTYPEKGQSVNRLVGIHIANALLANNIPFADSIGVNIHKWGPTAQFCRLKKYFSLVPLSSAYSPPEIHRCFGCAFAALVLNNLGQVMDSSVTFALKTIIRNVIKRAA